VCEQHRINSTKTKHYKQQATSNKQQATSNKQQATSNKQQVTSNTHATVYVLEVLALAGLPTPARFHIAYLDISTKQLETDIQQIPIDGSIAFHLGVIDDSCHYGSILSYLDDTRPVQPRCILGIFFLL
jgi:hypothetical protein